MNEETKIGLLIRASFILQQSISQYQSVWNSITVIPERCHSYGIEILIQSHRVRRASEGIDR